VCKEILVPVSVTSLKVDRAILYELFEVGCRKQYERSLTLFKREQRQHLDSKGQARPSGSETASNLTPSVVRPLGALSTTSSLPPAQD
jgi:hypothetical protein